MATGVVSWSQTAASNATADSTVNWQEGQAPSSVNDSSRAVMASVAKYRDDISGAIVTGGTSTAYTVTSYQVFPSLTAMHGQMIAFTPHVTNGATVTLNVDALGQKPLRTSPGVELAAGTLIQGTPYVATYNNTDGVAYLQGFYGSNPYNVPLGGLLDTVVGPPNSSFVYPYGQAISRTTYAALFAAVSTTFGAGDGSTTFNLPDLRGRIVAAADAMGGTAANRLTTATIPAGGNALGGTGGSQTNTIAQNNLPNVAPAFTGSAGTVTVTSTRSDIGIGANYINVQSGGVNSISTYGAITSTGSFTPTGSISSINGGVTQQAMGIIQPTIILYKILRII